MEQETILISKKEYEELLEEGGILRNGNRNNIKRRI